MQFADRRARNLFVALFTVFILLAITPLLLIWQPIRSQLDYWFAKDTSANIEYLPATDQSDIKKLQDSDDDSLSDFAEENIFFTNPQKNDTDDDGFPDNIEISVGLSPISPTKDRSDTDEDGLLDYQEIMVYHTNPNKSDTDGDRASDALEILSGTNPLDSANAQPYFALDTRSPDELTAQDDRILSEEQYRLVIPSLALDVPIIWTQTEDNEQILSDLRNGVGHAYNTGFPGQHLAGVYYGHSSSMPWSRGNYDTVFATLDKLNEGDQIVIQNPTSRYIYKVTAQAVTAPDDPEIFAQTEGQETITLVTCYPFGTAYKRLYVRAELQTLAR